MAPDHKRPAVDVVVPFAGSPGELSDVARTMGRLALGPSDTLTIVDNRPHGAVEVELDGVRVVRAPERQSSYFARNRGAAGGGGEWILFLDGDVEPPADLIERYFAGDVPDAVGVVAGGVIDEPLDPDGHQPAVARYAMLRAPMAQSVTLSGPRPYAKTANCAVRRSALEAVGGFRDDLRSGGDADLCWRVADAGWEIVANEQAAAIHRSRRTLRALLRQQARHGSGAAWLERQYPGALPQGRWLGLAAWTARSWAGAAIARARGRRDDALIGAIEPLCGWAFRLGRLFPNEVQER